MSWKKEPILILDTETTGLEPHKDRIIEFAWVTMRNGRIVSEGQTFLNPGLEELPPFIVELTGIQIEDVLDAPTFQQFNVLFLGLLNTIELIGGYNYLGFDVHFLRHEYKRCLGNSFEFAQPAQALDPLIWVRHFQKFEKGKRLAQAAARCGIQVDSSHRALADAKVAAQIVQHYMPKLPDDLLELIALQTQWDMEQQSSATEWRSKRVEVTE